MVNGAQICAKLVDLVEYLGELKEYTHDLTLEGYKNSRRTRRAVERDHNHPLIPVEATPSTICRWKIMKTTSIGKDAKNELAISMP